MKAVGDVKGSATAILEQLAVPIDSDELKHRAADFGVDNARKYMELMGII